MVARAREAQPIWEAIGFEGRAEVLLAARRWMVANAERVVTTIVGETGRPADETQFAELAYGLSALEFWAKTAPGYLADEEIQSASPFVRGRRLVVRYAPLGVIGVIGPWNYPLNNSFGDCIPALAAGNAVVLKPSEVTPLTSLLMAEMLAECGIPEGVFQVATGRGETGAALVDEVDMVMFTGSVETGKRVMARAAKTLTPVSLELGGKDPMIVLADADLERAANAAVSYGMNNSGQVCISVERVYVEEPVYDEFLERVTGKVEALRQGAARSRGLGGRRGDHLPAPARADRGARPRRGRQGRPGGHRRQARRGARRPLLRADRARRRRPLDALHDRGDLRADPAGDEGRRRQGGGAARQRRAVRAPGLGVDPRHREGGEARPAGRGGGLLRQRRPAQLRRARAADGRLEGVGARLAARAGRDPQVRQAPVALDHPRLRAVARAPHVPVLGRGHRAGGRCDQRPRDQRGVHGRAAPDPARLLRHAGPVAAAAARARTASAIPTASGRGPPRTSGCPRRSRSRCFSRAPPRSSSPASRAAARLAGRAGDGRRRLRRRPASSSSTPSSDSGPEALAGIHTLRGPDRCRCSTRSPTSAPAGTRAGTRSAIRGRSASRPPSRSRSPSAAPRPGPTR